MEAAMCTLMSACGQPSLKLAGLMPRPLMSAERKMMASNGANDSKASPLAAPDLACAASVISDSLPLACSAKVAGGSEPADAALCDSVIFPVSANGWLAAMVSAARTAPIGVSALAFSNCQLLLSPLSCRRKLEMMLRLPSAAISVSVFKRASATLRRNGAANDEGSLAGADGPVLCDVRLAICSSLIAIPSEKNCSGDQAMSISSAVTALSLPR